MDTKLVLEGEEAPNGDHRRQRHEARRPGPDRLARARFHGLRNRTYGTQVVAGVTPGKGGQDVEGIPVFDTVAEAVDETGANTSMVFVPARFAADAIYEAVDAGIDDRDLHRRGPSRRTTCCASTTTSAPQGITLIGPNCPGALSPGKANVGIIPAEIFSEGNDRPRLPLGDAHVPDRPRADAARARQLDDRRDRRRPGRRLVLHRRARASSRPTRETERIVMVGEIGGDEEEKAAAFIEANMTKPVLAYIAGFTAPPGKTMGHAGAIISGSSGTAQGKKEALEAWASGRHDADRGRRSSSPRSRAARSRVSPTVGARPALGLVPSRLLRPARPRPVGGRRTSGGRHAPVQRQGHRPPRRRLGLESIAVLGHSWGGVVAMEYAIRHSDRVRS